VKAGMSHSLAKTRSYGFFFLTRYETTFHAGFMQSGESFFALLTSGETR
jgi:hypothetical protein